MTHGSNETLPNTIEKLRMLEEMVEEVRSEEVDDEHLREVELESLQRLIVQLKEEIARGETREPARSSCSPSYAPAHSPLGAHRDRLVESVTMTRMGADHELSVCRRVVPT